ncbi:uncharacterized protein METZ01_LOCUS80618 [marine metagenome]|uniref:Uncharacterized protein n=1 Tax=marine metagenome TaxID=408172 RepID=A0A381UIG9_9ZZZZ
MGPSLPVALPGHHLKPLYPGSGLRVIPELQVTILPPIERMHRIPDAVARDPQISCNVVSHLVVVRHVIPHPMLDENVRRHVSGVCHRRGNLGVAKRCWQGQWGMRGVVKRVNRVVRRTGMVRVLAEHLQSQRASLHLVTKGPIVQRPRSAKRGNSREGGDLVIVRVSVRQLVHRLHVGHSPVVIRALLTPEHFHRCEEALLTVGRRLRQPLVAGRTQSLQHSPGIIVIRRAAEQRVVVTERLTPVGHRKIRVESLRRLELRDRLFPSEAMENCDPTQKMLLSLW